MTTPFKSVSAGYKDAFDFYHSQIRINIECAFGMLVNRWAVLRTPIPINVSIKNDIIGQLFVLSSLFLN